VAHDDGPVIDPSAIDGQRRRRRTWLDACPDPGCDGACDLVDCGCDWPCDLNLSLLGLIAASRPGRPPFARPTVAARLGMTAIRGYRRWLSPRLPTSCRHVPTCSGYGWEAVRRYGLLAGSRLTAARLCRCTADVPRGTPDPVP
jgi:putative membrane protein insertion efficiency factor